MKYLKYFEQASDYEAYKNGSDYILPNVSYIEETNSIKFNPIAAPTNLIKFTINGESYQAEEGMTWQEFVESSYNDGRISVYYNYVGHDGIWLANTSSGMSAPQDVIVPNYNYEYAAV